MVQGDNQTIKCSYSLPKGLPEEELKIQLQNIFSSNEHIMEEVEKGATKVGLTISRDEMIQSYDFITYVKTTVFRGNIISIEVKRWSRVCCIANDQIPSLTALMASVAKTGTPYR
jgi:Mononegavirales RNA dependent RNA polymerase